MTKLRLVKKITTAREFADSTEEIYEKLEEWAIDAEEWAYGEVWDYGSEEIISELKERIEWFIELFEAKDTYLRQREEKKKKFKVITNKYYKKK